MSKHTPGPWRSHKYPNNTGGFSFAILAGHAISVGGTINSDRIDPVKEADARMMAAAPELLDALEAYMNAGIGNSTDFAAQAAAHTLARAAVAKATGGAA